MEVISIDGIEYVRAAQLARKYRYTSDYIGQLCRSGKVMAKLVGRTWYVNPESIEGHKQGRYQKVSPNEKTFNSNAVSRPSRIDVEAVPRSETIKSISRVAGNNRPQYLRRIEWKPVKYEADNSELLPPLRPEPEPIGIPVGLAEAETLRIKDASTPTTLEAEPLPEIPLRGSLRIASVDDDFSNEVESDISLKNIDISSDTENEDESLHIQTVSKDRKSKVAIHDLREEKEPVSEVKPEEDKYLYDVPVSIERTSFSPRSVKEKSREVLQAETVSRSSSSLFIGLVIVVFVILASLTAVLSEVVSATADTVSFSYQFDLTL